MNQLKFKPAFGKIAAIAIGCLLTVSIAQAAVQNFTFIQISDEHSHVGPTTAATIVDLSSVSSVLLEPYGVTALPPSFVIETGDMTEFGPKNDNWDFLNKCYSSCKLERYLALGNHDGAWRSLTPEMTKLYGAPYYSFDKFGCHFIILDSAGLQDPRPVLSPEELDWLKSDLTKVGQDRPVFVAQHHPLDCSEFSSVYEADRLCDILRPYNIALVLVGHGHSAIYSKFDGFDMVEGGSGYGPQPGYQVISILDGKLRVAYKETGSAAAVHKIVEKTLTPPATRYPKISIQTPATRSSYKNIVPVKAWIGLGPGNISSAYADIDGSIKKDLISKPGGSFETEVNAAEFQPGAHYIRLFFKTKDGAVYHNSTCFYVDQPQQRVLWRTYIGAVSKSSPVADESTVYVGTNNGLLQAFDIQSGKPKWKFKTGGAVTCEPLILSGKVYFTSEDGYLYCVSTAKGKLIWKFAADAPIFSSPVSDSVSVYFGAANGAFYSVSASTGKLNWKNTSATYNIEIKPFIDDNGKIYFGCWDTYLYCLNTSNGKLVWKCIGQGSSEKTAPAYYSPADCGPVVCKGKVYVADRKYKLSIIDVSAGTQDRYIDSVSAVGLSADRSCVYIRKSDGNLAKIDSTGKELWNAAVSMDYLPAAPVDAGDAVYVCSKNGLISAVSSKDGKILWQYCATPKSFVLSSVGISSKCVFVAGTDGVLTAFKR